MIANTCYYDNMELIGLAAQKLYTRYKRKDYPITIVFLCYRNNVLAEAVVGGSTLEIWKEGNILKVKDTYHETVEYTSQQYLEHNPGCVIQAIGFEFDQLFFPLHAIWRE